MTVEKVKGGIYFARLDLPLTAVAAAGRQQLGGDKQPPTTDKYLPAVQNISFPLVRLKISVHLASMRSKRGTTTICPHSDSLRRHCSCGGRGCKVQRIVRI